MNNNEFSSSSLSGLWENNRRYIVFDDNDDYDYMTVVLKLFYGWYYDQATKYPVNSGNQSTLPKYRNNTYGKNTPAISSSIETVKENVFNIFATYPNQRLLKIPVALIDDGLYLSFWIKGSAKTSLSTENDLSQVSSGVFWRPASNIEDITVYEPKPLNTVYGWYILDNVAYKLRYWRTDAPYTEADAFIIDGVNRYNVDKYLRIGDIVYTCVHGLKTEIRNLEKTNIPDFLLSSDKTVMSTQKPYLLKSTGETTKNVYENLSDIITESNNRQKPIQKSNIEYLDLDFHYDDIDRILNKKGF